MKKMKNSGIEWIGEIPSEYSIIKFKHYIARTNAGEVIDKNYWNIGDELLYTCQRTPMLSNYSDFPDWKRTNKGDLLLTRNATPYIFIPEENAIYSNVVQRVTLKEKIDPYYIMYAVLCGAEALMVNGDTIPSYNMEVWKNIFIPQITYEEQKTIAEYLNKKCALIDSNISKHEDIIDRLKTYRWAAITEAVIKGLKKCIELKNSGIGWLGDIPCHWKIYRIANLYEEISESGDESLPILSVSINTGVSDRELSDEESDRVFIRSADKTKYKRVRPGYLTYNMMRAWQGAFGAVRVDGMVSPAYIVAKPKDNVKIDTRYIESLLRTPLGIEEMHRFSHGVADFRLRLYWPEFKNIRVCIPPIDEQKEIADYIDNINKQVDKKIALTESLISKLTEYKKALIYEAVTGKKEVL